MIKSNEGEEDEDWASVNVMVTGEYQKLYRFDENEVSHKKYSFTYNIYANIIIYRFPYRN
jgi:hypothetical protein